MRQLPAPAVEQLLSAEPGAAIVGACPVGDALTGSALMAATSDGKLHCLWPSGARTSDMVIVPDCEILGNPRYVLCGLTRRVLLVVIARVTDSVVAMQEEGARSVASDAASAEVEQMYGALLQGPRALRPPEGMGLPLRTPQGTPGAQRGHPRPAGGPRGVHPPCAPPPAAGALLSCSRARMAEHAMTV